MDLLFILRDALGSSAIGTLVAAVDAKQAGSEVAVLVTQEALAALAGASFDWPRALSNPPMRIQLADAGKELGLPVHARGAARKLDPKATVAWAREQGVVLYACPVWSALLGIAEAPPEGLEAIERAAATSLIGEAKQVIGSL
jgi:peroxiredoxin family protein